jgi:hypothetical protein
LSFVTERKQVEEAVRRVIARKISDMLDERTPDGKKVLTQETLGKKLGVSQEAARRAREADGVTPKIVKGMRESFNFVAFPVEVREHVDQSEATREEQAIELLVRRGVGLREAERAIKGARVFKHDEPLAAEEWADLAHSLVIANEKGKARGLAPSESHPKKPPRVGR